MQDNLIEIRDLRVAFNGHEVVHGVSSISVVANAWRWSVNLARANR